jgi:hypothetical protein
VFPLKRRVATCIKPLLARKLSCLKTAKALDLGREAINAPCERLARVRVPPMADVLLHGNETTRWARFRRFDLAEHQIG